MDVLHTSVLHMSSRAAAKRRSSCRLRPMKSTLPCFYVNSWTGSDGALLRYTRGANGLVPTEQVEANRTDGAPSPGLVKASGSLQAGAILLDLRRSDIPM